jgi:hypothetical protein
MSTFRHKQTFLPHYVIISASLWKIVGFEVLTVVGTKMAVFWVVASCSLVELPDYMALQPRRQPSMQDILDTIPGQISVLCSAEVHRSEINL